MSWGQNDVGGVHIKYFSLLSSYIHMRYICACMFIHTYTYTSLYTHAKYICVYVYFIHLPIA